MTRASIVDAAMRLFRERGYDETTMRAIAAEAGVSVGNAYYYFQSKEHLIQAFYDRAQADHAEAARPVLRRERDLAARIACVLEAWVDAFDEFHAFAGTFFKNAAEPTSPLSPFSQESTPAREAAIALWAEVIEGSDAKVPRALAADLPRLLWLLHMGVVLFWVYDASAGAARTRALVRRAAPIAARAVALARLPVLRATLADVLDLVADFTPGR